VVTPSGRALASGISLYDAGDFNGAIKRLTGAKEIWDDSHPPTPLPTKVAANKYLAFSYCVTNRRTQCRKHFVDALKLDADFTLEATEKKHPVWGPEYERAKKQVSAPAKPARLRRLRLPRVEDAVAHADDCIRGEPERTFRARSALPSWPLPSARLSRPPRRQASPWPARPTCRHRRRSSIGC
jgi:hypothetical protein